MGGKRYLSGILLGGLGIAGLAYLYAFEPGRGMPYPPCLFHELTGWHCPGCGSTRAVHALLHGNLAQAAAYNPLLLIYLPLLLGWVAGGWFWTRRRPEAPGLRLPVWLWWGLLTVLVVFGVLRNLPWEPFLSLAPHPL
jgi:hypothetical protein